MAPPSTATADTLISLKVNLDGSSTRFKLPLRDLAAHSFEDKLRAHLQIPLNTSTKIERYSDSAASFVTLDPADIGVYKQLYRAAKAKQKLKLRVTSKSIEAAREFKKAPKPATVEDEPEEVRENQGQVRGQDHSLQITSDEATKSESEPLPEDLKRPFTVSCNSCDKYVPDAHFHCSICDDSDFDLCQECVDRGVSCYGDGHWLIKRTIVDGEIKCSSTHISSKSIRLPSNKSVEDKVNPVALGPITLNLPLRPPPAQAEPLSAPTYVNARTCNCCVQEFAEQEFVHCTVCDDYDLCQGCFKKDQHGHHPMHGFTAAVQGTEFDQSILSKLEPGRGHTHNAICDGCDQYVKGVRHKCLDCPDWDYCADCVKDANFVHPGHRFVAIYEPLTERSFRSSSCATHYGICCDGPLCTSSAKGREKYIVGLRYKCAVCHDTDFCANCEACPGNTHNKTHPLIKFKTPVRHVSVTTTGEHEGGHRLPLMGDRAPRSHTIDKSSRESTPRETIAATPVQTVVNVQPTEPSEAIVAAQVVQVKKEIPEYKPLPPPVTQKDCEDLCAVFKWDTVKDGSILPPNHTFEQTWVLRNEGQVPWPAGCSVKFAGGDYMGAIDSAHPAGVRELVCASESTVCYNTLNPGQEFPFTVLMRTPDRPGEVISYWRLTTKDGVKFGHKLWCHVSVQAPVKVESAVDRAPVAAAEVAEKKETLSSASESRMIIPKLDHESPSGSIHGSPSDPDTEIRTETETIAASLETEDDFEDCGGQDDWAEESDDGFLTDEEYDILDASDEEYLSEQQKKVFKK